EDVASFIRLRLVDNGCDVLRRFEGRSSLRTFLVTVCERLLADWRTTHWGKWRPCEQARRIGTLAIELDRLLTRDAIPYEQGVESLLTRGMARNRAEIDRIRPQLAVRRNRWAESLDAIETEPESNTHADDEVVREERQARASLVGGALAQALATLSPRE